MRPEKSFIHYSVLITAALLSCSLSAQIVQWRGPERNGVFPDSGLMKEWPAEGPELIFMAEGLGRSYSSAIATGNAIYVTGLIDTLDYLTCLDHSGNILWQQPFGPAWDQSFPESRCTPTLEDNRIYVLSGKDNLTCFNAVSGEMIWEVDIHAEYGSIWDMFGVSESLLLVDGKVIVTPGGNQTTVVALDKLTGELVWKSESLGVERSNGSPVLYENDTLGIRQIIAMNRTHVLGVDPGSGEILWTRHYNFLNEKDENVTILANSPLFHEDDILISNGWDVPLAMLQISPDGKSVETKYENYTLDNQNHGLVRMGDFVYGSNFLERNFGKWVCMRWENGEIMWVVEWENKGPVIAADGMLYLMDEKRGNMALVRADENDMEIVSSFRIQGGKGPFWARPAIFGGRLYVRHGDALMVYDLKDDKS